MSYVNANLRRATKATWAQRYRKEVKRGPDRLPAGLVEKVRAMQHTARNAGVAAKEAGCSIYTVHVIWGTKRKMSLQMPTEIYDALHVEAKKRGVGVATLAQDVLAMVVEDKMFDAVLY